MAETVSFLSSIDAELTVRLYGKYVIDFNLGKAGADSMLAAALGSEPRLAEVYAAQVLGRCMPLPAPIIAFVPAKGDEPPTGCVGCFPSDSRMWILKKGTPLVTVNLNTTSVEEVFDKSGTQLGGGWLVGPWFVWCPRCQQCDQVNGITKNHNCSHCGFKSVNSGSAQVRCPICANHSGVSGITVQHTCPFCGTVFG